MRLVADERDLSSTETSADPAPGDVLDGRFKVIRPLGRGGAAAVFEVQHTITGQRRAMKIMHPQHARSGTDLARFVREAQVLAQLSGSGIPEVYDGGRLHDGSTYLLLELLDGVDLGEHLRTRGALPVADAVAIAKKLLEPLAAAHERGVIHRDVKPANVFITANREVKLLDFGIATHLAGWTDQLGHLTQTNALVGTPAYMAPETIGRQPLDTRVDLYAVGAILFRMLDGRARFEARGLVDLLGQIGAGGGRPLNRGDVPVALVELIDRAMSVDPRRRPQSATAFIVELDALGLGGLVSGSPVSGRVAATAKSSAPPATARPTKSRTGLAILSVSVLAAGLLAAGLFLGYVLFHVQDGEGGADASAAEADPTGQALSLPSVARAMTGIPECDRMAVVYCMCTPTICTGSDPVETLVPYIGPPAASAEETARACLHSIDSLRGCDAATRDLDLSRYDFEISECAQYLERLCGCAPLSCTADGNPLTSWDANARSSRPLMSQREIHEARRDFCARGLSLQESCD